MAKKVKKKLNIKGLLIVLLTLYLFIMLGYYIFTMPIKTILIEGNTILGDDEIILAAEIENHPPIFRTTTSGIKRKINALPLVKSVNISKSLLGKITITIEEEKVLFFNKTTNQFALSSGNETDLDKTILGYPTLINYTPSEIYTKLVEELNIIDADIIALISEIKYDPDIKGDITLDEYRFLLKMNDGNTVYINIANFENLNHYKEFFKALDETEKGVFTLDTSEQNIIFKTYEAIAKGEDGEDVELP